MTDSRAVRQAALVAGGLAVPLVVLTVLVTSTAQWLMSFDVRVVRSWEGAVVGTGWHQVFLTIAAVSQPVNVMGMLVLLAAVFWMRRRSRIAIWIVLVGAVSRVANLVIKDAVHRQRPDVPHQISGYSFPSGHSGAIATAMGVLIVLTVNGVDRPVLRRCLTAGWVAVAVVVGLDRIFLGAHYPSDVLAGWLLGALLAFGSAPLFGLGVDAADRAIHRAPYLGAAGRPARARRRLEPGQDRQRRGVQGTGRDRSAHGRLGRAPVVRDDCRRRGRLDGAGSGRGRR